MALPLEGIRVLDIATILAGPYGATLLGDMGADVIKIEPPAGDESRTMSPGLANESGLFIGVNRNKRGIVLDLTKPDGRDVYYRLVKTADVVVENMRADAEQRLGVSYEHTVQHNPRIIYISVSTFGESGPYAGRPGIDPLAQALTGFMSTTGLPGGGPLRTSVAIGDATCANLVAYAAMVGLWARERQGIGQRIELSLIDGLIHVQPREVGQYSVGQGHPRPAVQQQVVPQPLPGHGPAGPRGRRALHEQHEAPAPLRGAGSRDSQVVCLGHVEGGDEGADRRRRHRRAGQRPGRGLA
ncbi:MAG: CoA transferase [Chloroflexi bacterium]|nr:CoA transferase [Chloroflexota bacterium]